MYYCCPIDFTLSYKLQLKSCINVVGIINIMHNILCKWTNFFAINNLAKVLKEINCAMLLFQYTKMQYMNRERHINPRRLI
ncbi:hypothetical protein HEP_00113500 [Hepatocystis sp. ex Piliocolobus tephrosceles]|nr:hypothetical protein HEP_00113500 [Hepatocystis sp. ex Piliocolobus tephrosceles]